MSEEPHRTLIHNSLLELSCHFTWKLVIEDADMPDLERRIVDEDLPDPNHSITMLNLLAYVRHLKGQDEGALQSLREAEDLIQEEPLGKRSLVTWGNCAWVHYHMGSLAEAQSYLDKVENTCKEFASPFRYRMECAEMHCEKGWSLLKCGKQNYRQAMESFAKALEADSENPEYSIGYAVAAYRQDFNDSSISLEPLRKAVRLNPGDPYIKVLLALKLHSLGESDEAIRYAEEAQANISSQTYVLGYLAKFYRWKGIVEKALHFLHLALQAKPFSAFLHYETGRCYKRQLIQINKATNMQPRGQDRRIADQLICLAMAHFKKTLELKPTYEVAYVHLAELYRETGQLEEAEENFQKALSVRGLDGSIEQDIHFRYGCFQLYIKRSEETAITHYIKGLKIEVTSSYTKDKLLKALKNLAERRIRRNIHVVEGFGLLGFVCRLRGDTSEALEYYEQALRLTETLNPEF